MNFEGELNKPIGYLGGRMITLQEYVILEKMKDDFDVEPAKREDVEVFIKRHYLQKFPTGIKRIYAVYRKQTEGRHMVGMIIYGVPFMTAADFLKPLVSLKETLELKRLYIDDIGVRNIESFVIGQSLKLLKTDEPGVKIVLTFADDNQGHVGAIYQATNAIYVGKSDSGKHKYAYILTSGPEFRAIKDRLDTLAQSYPKKDATGEPPMTEANPNQANYDMLAQIKKELQAQGKLQPDLEPPDREAEREAERERDRLRKPYTGYQGAHKRKFDKQSKLINQPPLAENMENSPEYQEKLALLQKIHAELEKTGKIVPPDEEEGPRGYPDTRPTSTYQYKMKSPKTPRVVSNEAPPEDDDEFEQYVQKSFGWCVMIKLKNIIKEVTSDEFNFKRGYALGKKDYVQKYERDLDTNCLPQQFIDGYKKGWKEERRKRWWMEKNAQLTDFLSRMGSSRLREGEYDPKPQMGKSTYYPNKHPMAAKIKKAREDDAAAVEKAKQDAIKAQLLAKQQAEDLALKTKLMADYKKEHPAQKYKEIHELEKQIAVRRQEAEKAIEQARLAKEELKKKIAIRIKNMERWFNDDNQESDSSYHYHQDLQARAARQRWEIDHPHTPFPYHLKPSQDIDINDIETRAYQQKVIKHLQDNP